MTTIAIVFGAVMVVLLVAIAVLARGIRRDLEAERRESTARRKVLIGQMLADVERRTTPSPDVEQQPPAANE